MLSFKNKTENRSNPNTQMMMMTGHADTDGRLVAVGANIMCAARSCTSIYHAQHGDAASHHCLGDDQRTVVTHCYGLRETRIQWMFSYNFHAERSGALELES